MKDTEAKRIGPLSRLLAEARRAALGEAATPAVLIEAPDRELVRALKEADAAERRGLFMLLTRVGARGKRVAEQALGAAGLADEARLDALAFLHEQKADHPAVTSYHELAAALERGDLARAHAAFGQLPAPLFTAWVRRQGVAMMAPLGKGFEQWLLADGRAAAATLEALDRSTPRAVLEEIASLSSRCGSKPLQKAIRSAFFRLGQGGSEVPSLATGEPPGLALAEKTPLAAHAFLSAPDGAGDQGIWILEELSEGGYAVLQAMLGDDGKLGETRATVVVKRGFERLVADLKATSDIPTLEVPLALAIGVTEEAYARHPAAASRAYENWRDVRSAPRRARRPDPVTYSTPDRTRLIARSAELLDTDFGRFWHLDRADTEQVEKKIESESSPLVLSGTAEADRKSDALAAAAQDLFSRPRRERLARRLEAAARFLALRGETEQAAIAQATAEEILGGDIAPPFVRALIERSVGLLKQIREQAKDQQKSDPQAG